MSKYRINEPDLNGKVWIDDMENGKVFAGYDFMGSVDWVDYGEDGYWAEPDEAEQIVRDLEAADDTEEPEDPMVKKFQRILDAAIIDRDDFGKQWNELVNSKDDSEFTRAKTHRMYIRYQQAQGYLEGITTAIFAAGYGIVSSVDSTKLTVTK